MLSRLNCIKSTNKKLQIKLQLFELYFCMGRKTSNKLTKKGKNKEEGIYL